LSFGLEVFFHCFSGFVARKAQPFIIACFQVFLHGPDIRSGGGMQRPDFATHGLERLVLKPCISASIF
jgi:hypothetical protein